MYSDISHAGTDPLVLRCGLLSMKYSAGFLRYISLGEHELVRMINYYIRDLNWGTVPMRIFDEKIDQTASGFSITYRSECNQGDIQYLWKSSIQGNDDGSLIFEIEGEAKGTFKKNRLGFTVLHPLKTSIGKNCTITHSNQSQEILKFPELINPHQPFFDITEMRWNPLDSVEVFLQFEGDIFETEDQRNWCDASYKTYCTPIAIPYPVVIKSGDKIKQTVRLKVTTNKDAAFSDKTHPLSFSIEPQCSNAIPAIGVEWSKLNHDEKTIQRIKSLKVDYIRVLVDFNDSEMQSKLSQALQAAPSLELVLFVEGKPNEQFFEKVLSPISANIKQIIVLPANAKTTQAQLINDYVPWLRKNFPLVKVGGGTDAFFTELNRERTPVENLDFINFSINPTVHAIDDTTIVENLEPEKDIVETCRSFSSNKPIHVGPVTFKMRWNPGATSKDPPPVTGFLPATADERQISLFGAAWMLGNFKYLAENNVSCITYFETCGWKGFLPHADEPWPESYLGAHTLVYPSFIILKELLSHKHNRVVKLVSNYPLIADGLALMDSDGKLLVYLMNFTGKDQLITLPINLGIRLVSIINDLVMKNWIKDPEGYNLIFNETGTLSIPPYGIAVLKQ